MEGHQAGTRQIQAPPNTEPSLTCSIVRFLKGPLLRHDPGFGEGSGNSQLRNSFRWKCLGLPSSNFQSSLRDFSSLESLPRDYVLG
jgi:hypothetical protein